MAQHHSASAVGADGNGVNEGKIRAAHLLVKHKDSRRPKSWKDVGHKFIVFPSEGLSWREPNCILVSEVTKFFQVEYHKI